MPEVDRPNPYAKSVIHYNDRRLSAIIKSPSKYSPELVEACKTEEMQRNLGHFVNEDIPEVEDEDDLTLIKRKLSRGISIENCEAYLLNKGISKKEALILLEQAARTAPLKETKVQPKENNGWGIWSVLITAFFVIRMLIRLFEN